MESYSQSQYVIFILLGILTLLSGLLYSLQAPFYPIEAQAKGVTISEIGFIYGIYELTSFIVAPVAGTLMTKSGPVAGLHWGLFLNGIGILGLGFLDLVKTEALFIILSVLLRMLQAVGATYRAVAIVSMITFTFQDAVATTFASMECFFGVGVCSGALIAGYLMQLTGFKWTFIILGTLLLATIPISLFILNKCEVSKRFQLKHEETASSPINVGSSVNQIGLFSLLKIPSIALSVFSVVATAISLGFTMGVLEPHLQQFKLNPVMIGLMFLFRDLAYAISSPVLGCLFDKIDSPHYVRLIGPVLIFLSFTILGPAPFVPSNPVIWLTAIGLVLLGVGMGSTFVSSFLFALQDAKKANMGQENDIRLNELISGIWRSSIALGLFAGPSIAGALYDAIGFPYESLIVIGLQIFQMVLIAVCLCFKDDTDSFSPRRRSRVDNEAAPLLTSPQSLT